MKFRILVQELGRFSVEYGVITGIIFGKVLTDYVIFRSFSAVIFTLGSFSAIIGFVILISCNKIKYSNCKN